MSEEFTSHGINWEGDGYFGCPEPPADFVLPPDPMNDPWLFWRVTFRRARDCDFGLIPKLSSILVQTVPSPLSMVCSDLLGSAGTPDCFVTLIKELEAECKDFELIDELSSALTLRGMLSDVPVLLGVYERNSTNEDADILPIRISELLEAVDNPLPDPSEVEEVAEYHEAVMSRYYELAERYGSEKALIYRGKPYSVRSLAHYIKDRVLLPYPPFEMRQRFEAATGIDCTSFYQHGEIQPLAVAAIVEEFLGSPEAEKYEEGVRYFFGHRIPD